MIAYFFSPVMICSLGKDWNKQRFNYSCSVLQKQVGELSDVQGRDFNS